MGFFLARNPNFPQAGRWLILSLVIRQVLVQLKSPDEMCGRVSAINYVFIGTSNELGGFESSIVAYLTNPVFSVVFGGAATLLTVLGITLAWPELRQLNRLLEAEKRAQTG